MKKILLFILLATTYGVNAQGDVFNLHDDLSTTPADTGQKQMTKLLHILSEFRFQAYVQAEWQRADTAGVPGTNQSGTNGNGVGAYQGGLFPMTANNRFMIRRGRFKFSFEHINAKNLKVMDFAFQLDATERGFTIKDFYGRLIDPWLGWFSIQGGVFLRPFGFESPAPPAFAESPEFSRVNQTVLPNEVELGEAIVIESPAKFETVYLRLDANLVNGNGVGIGSGNQVQTGTYDSRKDFIGRIKVGKMWDVRNAKLGLNGTVSYYNGGVLQTGEVVEALEKNSSGKLAYADIGSQSGVGIVNFKREYYGAHLEFKADYPVGITTLRGEFIAGQQPGGQSSSTVTQGYLNNSAGAAVIYLRRFDGAMFYLIQSFKNKVKDRIMMHDITIKYDWYNPQDRVSGADKTLPDFAFGDIAFSTLGVGYSFIPVNFFKLMIWYDHVMNQITSLPGWTSDYKHQDVLTIRTQFYVDSWWFYSRANKYKDNLMLKKY